MSMQYPIYISLLLVGSVCCLNRSQGQDNLGTQSRAQLAGMKASTTVQLSLGRTPHRNFTNSQATS